MRWQLLAGALLAVAASRRVIIHGVYEHSMDGLSCPIAPVVNHHTLKAANRSTSGPKDVGVYILLDEALSKYCAALYHRFAVQTLPLKNADGVKSAWQRFDLGDAFQQGDKLLFLDVNAYLTGMEIDAIFDLVSDSKSLRFLLGSDIRTSMMLLSYQPSDFRDLMDTRAQLTAKGVTLATDRELFVQYALARDEKLSLPNSMAVSLPHDINLHAETNVATPRVVCLTGDLLQLCEDMHLDLHKNLGDMAAQQAYICCNGKLVADAMVEHGASVSFLA